jgi:hypothetical protein
LPHAAEADNIFLEFCALLLNDMEDIHLQTAFKFVLAKRFKKEQLVDSGVVKDDNQYYYVHNNKKIEERMKNQIPISTTHGGRPNTTAEKEKKFDEFVHANSMPYQDRKRKGNIAYFYSFDQLL